MIRKLLAGIVANGVALYAAVVFVPGFSVEGGLVAIFIAAIVLGLINIFLKPLLRLVSLPFIVITMGVFSVVINAVTLWLTRFGIAVVMAHPLMGSVGVISLNFAMWTDYVFAAVIVSLVNYVARWFLKLR